MPNSKPYGVYERSAHQMTLLLLEILLFLVRAAYKLRSVSYASKHALWLLSNMPYCAYLHAQLEKERSYKIILPIKQLLYYRRYLFSGLELYVRYDRRVMIQACIAITFWYDILCILSLVTWKLQVRYGHSTYWMTALLSIICVRAVCETWMMSYGSRHASQSLSDKPFVRTCKHHLKTSNHIWKFVTSKDCYIIEGILCVF